MVWSMSTLRNWYQKINMEYSARKGYYIVDNIIIDAQIGEISEKN